MKILYVEGIDAWGTRSDGWMPREEQASLKLHALKSADELGHVDLVRAVRRNRTTKLNFILTGRLEQMIVHLAGLVVVFLMCLVVLAWLHLLPAIMSAQGRSCFVVRYRVSHRQYQLYRSNSLSIMVVISKRTPGTFKMNHVVRSPQQIRNLKRLRCSVHILCASRWATAIGRIQVLQR